MKLQIGERLEGAGPKGQPGGYVVTGVMRETPWYGLYTARKVLYNFDFTAKRLRETDEVEWLDVLLRTIRYPILDDRDYVSRRRSLARAEVRLTLGNRKSNLWPEPIDLLEVENTRDPFAYSGLASDTEPIAVLARPHGRFADDWQKEIVPVTSILAVLAELLEFVRQSHEDGLVLQGLGPGALLIDASDRLHYLGSDMALPQSSPLLREESAAADWARHFPPERFPVGFMAPECVQPGRRLDVRSDLYAWGALAYSLATSHNLGQLARAQGQAWARFHDEHFAHFADVLGELGSDAVETWADQLGVPAAELVHGWPGNVRDLLRLLLHPDPSRRPASVAELRRWLIEPPPLPVAHLVALHVDAGVAKLLFDCSLLPPELSLHIQRDTQGAPDRPGEGVTIHDGPLRPIVVDNDLPVTAEPIHYTAFTRRPGTSGDIYSAGASTLLWQPDPANLQRWAEQQAAESADHALPPAHVSMVISALDPCEVGDALLGSARVKVRGWALWRLQQALRSQAVRPSLAESLLWRLVRDPSASLRTPAAVSLWQHATKRDDALLIHLLEVLDAPPVDAPVPLSPFLAEIGLEPGRAAEILKHLEATRPRECPVCRLPFPLGEHALHLRTIHGYVDLDGEVMPAPAARARLWERVIFAQAPEDHVRLLDMYLGPTAADGGPARYVADLEQQFVGAGRTSQLAGGTIPVAIPFEAYSGVVAALRQSPHCRSVAALLLQSDRPRLRELGREALVPVLIDRLSGNPTALDVEQALEEVRPGLEWIDEKMALCERLSLAGVEPGAITDCMARYREDRLVECHDCGAHVRRRDLEIHLRRAHDIFEFRGERGSYNEVRAAILEAVCTPPADPGAWRSLQSLAGDRHPGAIDRTVMTWVYHHLKGTPAERSKALVALAEIIVASGSAERMVPLMLSATKNRSWEQLGRRISLEICARLEPAAAAALAPMVQPLLSDRDISRRCRESAAMSLLRATGKEGRQAVAVLKDYVAGSGSLRAVEKLQQLEQRFGHAPALDEVIAEYDGQIRMTCPRCPTQLRKKAMVRHLWDRHRLVLDGQCVREPWRVLEDWAVDYGLEKDAELLSRCRELALRADPEGGLLRLYRLMYRHGVRERDILVQLQAAARKEQASLCPSCFEHVPTEQTGTPAPLSCAKNRLEGHGYRLEVSERGLVPELHVESPTMIVHQGREPGRGVTRLGALVLLVAPLVLLALLVLSRAAIPTLLLLVLVFGLGLLLTGMVYLLWPDPPPMRKRLLRAAWNLLVPDLLETKLGRQEWAMLRALADFSRAHPDVERTSATTQACCEAVTKPARSEPLAAGGLASLSRLYALDLRREERDPVPFLVSQGVEALRGKLPLSFLASLLEGLAQPDEAWALGTIVRLQILLAQEAFMAELDLDDWLGLGRAFPPLGNVLGLTNRWQWLQRYGIWAEHNRRPWAEVAPAVTVFELAEHPDQEKLFETYPDILLYATRSQVLLGSKGVWYQGVCIGSYSPDVDIQVRYTHGEHPYEVQIGTQTIPCDRNPTALVDELRQWLHYYFIEFLPRLPGAAPPIQESNHRLWQANKISCPNCGRALVPCPGDVGIRVR